MNQNWKQDPRIKNMDSKKLQHLTELADKIGKTPQNQLLPTFATMSMEAKSKGIQFTDQETDLLVSILSTNMSAADKKKLDTLKMLSKRLGK